MLPEQIYRSTLDLACGYPGRNDLPQDRIPRGDARMRMRIVDHIGGGASRRVAAWATGLGFHVTYDPPQGQISHECGAIAALTVHTFRALKRDFDALLRADVTAHLETSALDAAYAIVEAKAVARGDVPNDRALRRGREKWRRGEPGDRYPDLRDAHVDDLLAHADPNDLDLYVQPLDGGIREIAYYYARARVGFFGPAEIFICNDTVAGQGLGYHYFTVAMFIDRC